VPTSSAICCLHSLIIDLNTENGMSGIPIFDFLSNNGSILLLRKLFFQMLKVSQDVLSFEHKL